MINESRLAIHNFGEQLQAKQMVGKQKVWPVVTTQVCNMTAEEISSMLDQLYPGNKVHGFKAGDFRGAFTMVRKIR